MSMDSVSHHSTCILSPDACNYDLATWPAATSMAEGAREGLWCFCGSLSARGRDSVFQSVAAAAHAESAVSGFGHFSALPSRAAAGARHPISYKTGDTPVAVNFRTKSLTVTNTAIHALYACCLITENSSAVWQALHSEL